MLAARQIRALLLYHLTSNEEVRSASTGPHRIAAPENAHLSEFQRLSLRLLPHGISVLPAQ
ncbi:hypothetical protein PUN4_500017 [Paraburkholderia unamae]|nr:hypothetical protein PUN4_500017 [Paraburkholderia unamae]